MVKTGEKAGRRARPPPTAVGEAVRAAILARGTALAAFLLVVMSMFSPTRAPAMELKIVGNQIILSGPVVGNEPGKVQEALASSPGIDTVILRN